MPDEREALFNQLFRDHHSQVFRLALGLTGSPADAEEITQEAFLRAFRSYPSFRGESSFFTWIYRIAVNVAHDYIKRRKKLPIEVLEEQGYRLEEILDPNPSNDPETVLLSKDVRFHCLHCITECLPVQQRKIFILAVVIDLPYAVIAEVVECSLASVKTSLHRAKKRIASYLENRCQLIKKTNPCRCEQWVRFTQARGWVNNWLPVDSPLELKLKLQKDVYGLLSLRDIYISLYPRDFDSALAQKIKERIEKQEWAIFS